MASVQKYAETAVVNILRHNSREVQNPSNKDINPDKYNKNYKLSPERDISDYSYYKERLSQLYRYGRADVKTLCGWVVTAPKDLPIEKHLSFFHETYNFLENRYGRENTVQAIVHNDESGQPHLHYCFIPAAPNTNPRHQQAEKVCANDILNRAELRDFHPALEKHLRNAGISARILNGATAGGNRTVTQLKHSREHERGRGLFLR